jgi:WD40 repeat protein
VIVSGSDDRTVRMRDAASGALMHTLEGHEDWVRSVALGELSGQSVIVSGSSDRTVRVWDAASGALLQTICFGSAVYSVVLGKKGEVGVGTSRGVLMLKLTPAIFDNK